MYVQNVLMIDDLRQNMVYKKENDILLRVSCIRKDCFQVKSNLLTVDNLVFHFELQFLIKLK